MWKSLFDFTSNYIKIAVSKKGTETNKTKGVCFTLIHYYADYGVLF